MMNTQSAFSGSASYRSKPLAIVYETVRRHKAQECNFIGCSTLCVNSKSKGKTVPLQAWSGPEGSRKLRFPDFMIMEQDGGKVVSLTTYQLKGKAVPLQTWSGPEGSRKLRFPDFMKTAQDDGKVVSLTHRPPLPTGNTPGTHFC